MAHRGRTPGSRTRMMATDHQRLPFRRWQAFFVLCIQKVSEVTVTYFGGRWNLLRIIPIHTGGTEQ
jgi:hypothetical protein